ncbi:MAG: TPM domain-containing protein [Deltaproteobacteria bacterium]|nr:TPM domain-containing protein [Deltaproteobacteria bacterium]
MRHMGWRFGKGLGLVCLLTLCLLCVGGPTPARALTVPQYQGYVTDLAGMISPPERQKLEQTLLAFEQSDSTQIAVLTIPSLEGDALEDFSIRTVEAWKIGQKGKDNGVLLLVSKGDRKIRIEVGRGLEGVLTDLRAGRIVDQVITPRFKAGQLDEGFEAGISTIISATRGEFKGSGRVPGKSDQSSLLPYLIFFAILVGTLGRLSKPAGAVTGAVLLPLFAFLGLSSPLGWLLLLLLIPGGALLGLILPILFANAGAGGFFMGGGFGGGDGGDSGFGGFGGGGFGGGGASGGW